jgi:orotidine-5'-phosphate decarboxylase
MKSDPENDPRVIVALDVANSAEVERLVARLTPQSCRLKVGKELFTREGPDMVRQVVAQGFDVFLDLKFHDIPTTVARACEAAAALDVWMLNVHTSGGRKMMQAAGEALGGGSGRRPLLVGVTVLTSLGVDDLKEIGIHAQPAEQVSRLAALARSCGLDGVVCSPREAAMLRNEIGPDFALVTPGVRPAGASNDDQTRVLTPREAIRGGADYLVVGRPITRAADPAAVLDALNAEIAGALNAVESPV